MPFLLKKEVIIRGVELPAEVELWLKIKRKKLLTLIEFFEIALDHVYYIGFKLVLILHP